MSCQKAIEDWVAIAKLWTVDWRKRDGAAAGLLSADDGHQLSLISHTAQTCSREFLSKVVIHLLELSLNNRASDEVHYYDIIIMTNIVINVIIFLNVLHHDLVTTSDIVCDNTKCSSDDRPCQGLHQLNPPKIVPGMEWWMHLSSIIISAIIWNGIVQTLIFGVARTK